MKGPRVPAGWRKLRAGTIVRKGDKFWCVNSWARTGAPGKRAGFDSDGKPSDLIYIRRKPKPAKAKADATINAALKEFDAAIEEIKAAQSPLTVEVVGGKLIASIGVGTLAFAALHDGPEGPPLTGCTINDNAEFARDVRNEMMRESEDGETPFCRHLDAMIKAAAEGGSAALEFLKKRTARRAGAEWARKGGR